jgi:hypothetical protein
MRCADKVSIKGAAAGSGQSASGKKEWTNKDCSRKAKSTKRSAFYCDERLLREKELQMGNAGKARADHCQRQGPLSRIGIGACRHRAALSDSLQAIVGNFSSGDPERLTCTRSRGISMIFSTGRSLEFAEYLICTSGNLSIHMYIVLCCWKTPALAVPSPAPIRHAKA